MTIFRSECDLFSDEMPIDSVGYADICIQRHLQVNPARGPFDGDFAYWTRPLKKACRPDGNHPERDARASAWATASSELICAQLELASGALSPEQMVALDVQFVDARGDLRELTRTRTHAHLMKLLLREPAVAEIIAAFAELKTALPTSAFFATCPLVASGQRTDSASSPRDEASPR